jgi:hypothetical protein
MFQHKVLKNGATKPLEIWIGTKEEVEEQLRYGFTNTEKYKPLPNTKKPKPVSKPLSKKASVSSSKKT